MVTKSNLSLRQRASLWSEDPTFIQKGEPAYRSDVLAWALRGCGEQRTQWDGAVAVVPEGRSPLRAGEWRAHLSWAVMVEVPGRTNQLERVGWTGRWLQDRGTEDG